MELFIQIQDGVPFEHPIFADNFREVFPDVDTSNLPDSFARFIRVEPPQLDIYQVYEGVTYEWQDGVVTDVHHVRAMTNSEITAKQNAVKAFWLEYGFPSWTFNETTCSFDPPVAYPSDNQFYIWDEPTLNWIIPVTTP